MFTHTSVIRCRHRPCHSMYREARTKGKAQRLQSGSPEQDQTPDRRNGRDVPPDGLVDQAAPDAAPTLQPGSTLEAQATASLAAAEAEEPDSTVTALSEAPSRRTESDDTGSDGTAQQDADSVWLGLPAL